MCLACRAALATCSFAVCASCRDADEKVPYEQSERLAARLRENQVPHQLITRHNAGHSGPEFANDYALLADWFDQHLRPADPRPPQD